MQTKKSDPATEIVMAVAAVALSIVTAGAAAAAIGAMEEAAATTMLEAVADGATFAEASAAGGIMASSSFAVGGFANAAIAGAVGAMSSSAFTQLATTGNLSIGQIFKAGAVGGLTAGLTNGVTYDNGSLGIASEANDPNSLANLAGAQSVGNGLTGSTVTQAGDSTAATLGTRIGAAVADSTISAGVQTLIDGGSFGNALKNSLVGSAAAAGAYAIGNEAALDGSPMSVGSPGYILAHGLLGCAASAAQGTGCASGAIGGASGALINPMIDSTGTIPAAALIALTSLAGGSIASALGYSPQGAMTAAQNETQNNWLNHIVWVPGGNSEAVQLTEDQKNCSPSNAGACSDVQATQNASAARDVALASACAAPSSASCLLQTALASMTGNTVKYINGTAVATPTPPQIDTPLSPGAAALDNMLGSPFAGILGGLSYGLGGSNTDAYYSSQLGVSLEGIAAGVAGIELPKAPSLVPTNNVGAASSVAAEAAAEAEALIASGSKNPAVSVAGDPVLGIQTTAFTNIIAKVPTFDGVTMSADNSTFTITDPVKFMNGIVNAYNDAGQTLNPLTKQYIQNYISSQNSFPVQAGIPGLHAEVQSLNSLYNSVPDPNVINPNDIVIATNKIGKSSSTGQQGGAFQACTNCSGVIPSSVNVITGRK